MPTKDEALQFALMLSAGMPSLDAFKYFAPEGLSDREYADLHRLWQKSKEVSDAILTIQGHSWQDMTAEERIKFAIEKSYVEMAYFIYSNNYTEAGAQVLAKYNQARTSLEAKVAGMAGKMNPLDRFLEDAISGKITVPGIAH